MLKHVRRDLHQVPGVAVTVGSYLRHRMDHALSGVNADLAIKLFGPETQTLKEKGHEIEEAARSIPGLVDVQLEQVAPVPQIAISIDREAAARYGISVLDLSRQVEVAFNGKVVSQVTEGQKSFDLVVWFAPEQREDLETIAGTLVDTAGGGKVPLSLVAAVKVGATPNIIRHESLSRLITVQANVSGRDLASAVDELDKAIAARVSLPPGYYVVYGGQFESQQRAKTQLTFLSLLACFGIFLLLCSAFSTWKAAALVMVNLPLALAGGIWAVVLSGGVLSVGSLIGFITLFGISTRNGIMLVSHFGHLLAAGGSFNDVLIRGARDRLIPVLMTALTASLGVLPVALLGGAGRELEQPLAIVILGGLFTSTALTLLVIPVLFKLVGPGSLAQVKVNDAAGGSVT